MTTGSTLGTVPTMYYQITPGQPLPPNLFEISSLAQVNISDLKEEGQGTNRLARLIHDAANEVITLLREKAVDQDVIIVTPLQVLAADNPGGQHQEPTGETDEEGEDIYRAVYNPDGTPMMREPTIGYSAFCTVAFETTPTYAEKYACHASTGEPAWMTLPPLDEKGLADFNWRDARDRRHIIIDHVLRGFK